MSDYNRSSHRDKILQCILNGALGFCVQRGRRFVENQNGGILEQSARDRQTLALPAGKLHTHLADYRIVAAGQSGDEIMRVRRCRRRDDILHAASRLAVGDVIPDRVVKEEGMLRDNTDLPA